MSGKRKQNIMKSKEKEHFTEWKHGKLKQNDDLNSDLQIDFPTSFANSVNKKYVYSAKKQLPEFVNSSNMVNVMSDDDMFFNKVDLARPTNYYLYIEKSMYQTISEEMVKMFKEYEIPVKFE